MVDKTTKEILEAIEGSAGLISTVAKRLGVAWDTARSLINREEEITTAYNNEKEKIKDMAESVVIGSIKKEDVQTAKWYLGIMGKDRGYDERRLEITLPKSEILNFVRNLQEEDIDRLSDES